MSEGCEDDDPIEDETDTEMCSAVIDENNDDNNDGVFKDQVEVSNYRKSLYEILFGCPLRQNL